MLRRLPLPTLVATACLIWPSLATAQGKAATPRPDAESAEDARERQVVERFVALLERNPRRGTALDRIYGYHVERGSLDRFLKTYEDRVAKDPSDGAAWLILGLFESQRGRDAAAVSALRQAETHRPGDPLPSFYLGQALVLIGQPEAAAEAFERAIARKPARADLLEVYQALGRSYQRTRRNAEALAVWARLEAQFPADLRVKEQVADALAEDSQLAQALPRYEALAAAVKDQYRQVQFRIEAAELKVRLGRPADALADFEGLLGRLNPESWLYREVRRRIEEVFLRNDDLAGLASYYERWIKKTPDDVEALAKLGRTLASQGRTAEARGWLEKAVKMAPTRRELRLALIDQLVQEGKYADAAKQYEALSQADPRNLDVVREWGRLLLKDASRPPAERKAAAGAVWGRLTGGPAPDPLVLAQVADLFRQAEMVDEAIAHYKSAIERAPDATQYREYLGEYYHTLKRPDEAQATWRALAEGPRRDARNLARLGEVLAGFGYRKEAADAFAEAVRLDDDEFDLRLKYADVLAQLDRFDDALAQLGVAERLAGDADQTEAVLGRQIKAYQGSNTLAERAGALRRELDEGRDATAARWLRLARLLEADQKPADASAAVRKAIELEPQAVPARVAAARILEAGGDLAAAADMLRELTSFDRRARSQYLAGLAKLEARLGRREPALAAGRELIAASPGNVEAYQTFADLCFELGEVDEGLDALRRSVRANPADAKVALALAEALAQRFRTDEAIELFWRAFEKSAKLEDKLSIVSRLAELCLQCNQFDRLVARLERMQDEPDHRRETSLCLAQAHAAGGDLGTARQELERLLASNPRDTPLLQQLSTLSETEGDLAPAIKYQRQVVEIAPTDEASLRLAQLELQHGDAAEAEAVWARLAGSGRESWRVLQAIDGLLAAGRRDTVLILTERLIRRRPDDWEAIYREGMALAGLDRPDEAARRFRAVLDLHLGDDEPSEFTRSRGRGGSPGRAAGTPATSPARPQSTPLEGRLAATFRARLAAGLEPAYRYGITTASWSPADFGQARLAALGWLWARAQTNKATAAFLAERREAVDKAPRDPRPAWDWYLLQNVRQEWSDAYEAARSLAERFPNDPSAAWAYLHSLGSRLEPPTAAAGARRPVADTKPPLPPAEVDRVVATFDGLRRRRPDWARGTILLNTIAELKRAQRAEEEGRIYREVVDSVSDAAGLATAMQLAGERGDVDGLLRLLDKGERLLPARGVAGFGTGLYATPAYSLMRAMAARAEAKAHAEIPRVIERYLLVQRRLRQAGKAPRPPSGAVASRPRYVIVAPGTTGLRSVQVDYPTPNVYLDQDTLALLRWAYETFKRDDLLSDLVDFFRARTDAGSPEADRLEARLALSAFAYWEGDVEHALDELKRAVALAKGDAELALALAELHERRDEPDEALAVVDAIEALDNTVLQRREMAALRLAVATGDVDRARAACDRLFGLRLDAESQTMLAGQMHQLGMHEQAEAVLARARRRAGQRTTALVGLMAEYQRQDKVDLAVQVAHQILRRGSGRSSLPPGSYSSDDLAREQAVQVLARSGKLKETIGRLEAQAERAPNALALQQSLADFYRAAGDREKLRATYQRMAALKPDDARLRYQVATQLLQSGDAAGAVEHFRAALVKEPMLLASYQFSTVQGAFQQARKTDELFGLLESLDLRAIGNPYVFSEVINTLVLDPKTKERGRKLLGRLWEAYPDQRLDLVRNLLHDETLWTLPESYDMLRQAVIPSPAQARVDPWYGMTYISIYMGDGRAIGPITRLLGTAAQHGKLADLARDLESAIRERPQWSGGAALLAAVRARSGRADEARSVLEPLADDRRQPIPMGARRLIAQEVEDVGSLQDVAVRLYEAEIREYYRGSWANASAASSPIRRLVALYQRAGRNAEARGLLRKLATARDYANYAPESAAMRKVSDMSQLAAQMLDLGAPVDAIRLYAEIPAAVESLPAASPMNSNREMYRRQVEQGLARALRSIRAEDVGAHLASLLDPPPDGKAGRPTLDLVLMVHPREVDRAAVFSMVDALLAATAARLDARAEARAKLADLVERSPDDIPVQVAVALAALADGAPEPIDRATRRLAELVERTPLEPLPPTARANARLREEAARQLGLWLVARACWKVDSVRDRGDAFAARALEAARRQADGRWSLAMLREWGQAALDRGDRKAAEAHWSRMLDLILASTREPKPPAQPKPTRPGSPLPAPAPAPTPAPARAKARVKKVSQAAPPPPPPPVVVPPRATVTTTVTTTVAMPAARPAATSDRFEQATQLARLAADRGMIDLSIRAVREALRGGPPVAPLVAPTDIGMGIRRTLGPSPNASPGDALAAVVEAQLGSIVGTWRRHGVAAAPLYEVLRDCVLPESRPAEVFVYARPLVDRRLVAVESPLPSVSPKSVARLLVQAAVEAGRADELRRATEARRSRPTAEPAASVLLTQLGMASGDEALAGRSLADLDARLARDTLPTSAELACHAALPALDVPGLSAAGAAVLERAVRGLSTLPGEEPLWTLQRRLARHWFKAGQPDRARKALDEALAATDREMGRGMGLGMADVDYGIYRRKQAYLKVATELAKAGQLSEALDLLGRYCDAGTERASYGGAGQQSLPAPLVGRLLDLPAAERYERLKAWTMPTAARASARLVALVGPGDPPPPPFLDAKSTTPGASDVVSSIGLLVDAARDVGKLDGLADELGQASEKKIEGAEALFLLAQVARGRGADVAPRMAALADELHAAVPDPGENAMARARIVAGRKRIDWPDYLIARACLADGKLFEVGERMAVDLIALSTAGVASSFSLLVRADLAERRWTRAGGGPLDRKGDPGLSSWQPGLEAWAARYAGSLIRGASVAHEGHLVHEGNMAQALSLAVPLAGSFEFSVEALLDATAGATIVYGGTRVAFEANGLCTASRPSGTDSVSRPTRFVRADAFNRLSVQAESGRVRFLINGHLLHEDTNPSAAYPWVVLGFGRRGVYRNPTLTGTPRVPREVRPADDPRLEGWTAGPGETKLPASAAEPTLIAMSTLAPRREDFDWSADGGVITGRRTGTGWPREVSPSHLAYNRPLGDGETVRYRFFYEPDAAVAHPTLGCLAFLLEPEGVRPRWLAPAGDDRRGEADPVVDDPDHRRGPARLPLHPGEWNGVALTLAGGVLRITLNDALVYERALDPSLNGTFGLYHDKDRSEARVRDVLLEGDWPEAPPSSPSALLARRRPLPESDILAGQALVGEDVLVQEAGSLARRARALPPAERLEVLAAWVLPGATHPTFRLQGEFAPPGPGVGAPSDRQGSRIEAPAYDLIAVAREVGKLDELAARVESLPAATDLDRRGRLALTALLRTAQGRAEEADAAVAALRPLVAKLEPDAAPWRRWPELLVASAISPKGPDSPVSALLQALASVPVKPGAPVPHWLRHARHLDAVARAEGQVVTGTVAGWSPVWRGRPETRGEGDPVAVWWHRDGQWSRTPGDADDSLEFGAPLRPPFAFEAELASSPTVGTQVAYGGLRLGLDAEGARLRVSRSGLNLPDVPLAPPLDRKGPWHAFRLVARAATLEVFVDGRKAFESPLLGSASPWLAIHSAPDSGALARGLKVAGTPDIPRTLVLSGLADLSGWSADEYRESTSGPGAAWETKGDEILGTLLKPSQSSALAPPSPYNSNPASPTAVYATPGSRCESLLRYRRPLLEGGALEYDFFHDPSRVMVHPALGALAFLLESDGVKVHRLTDGPHDRSGRARDDARPEPEHRRGPASLPLRPGEWNRVAIALSGDTLALRLNGVLVLERPLDAAESRLFGLFHFADETAVRVRQVTLRGDWPATLAGVAGASASE